ncbi:MAG: hypothetical protein AAF449_03735 [Myxococcota bacterium]
MMTKRLYTVVNLAVSVFCGSCLSDPELKDCIDFPIGTDGCPTGCSVYCERMLNTCPGEFDSIEECNTDCAVEPVNRSLQIGEFGERENNTLSCRISYLLEGNCEGATLGEQENELCVGASCDEYCTLMAQNCPDAFPPAESMFCENVCPTFPRGASDADANTVECRLRYAALAAQDTSGLACDAASVNGGGVCGDDPCIPYCDSVMRACTGDNVVYQDRAECMRTCAYMNDGFYTDWDFSIEVDSVQCRTYHAGPPADAVPTTHCPHTRIYNEEHCGSEPGPGQPADWPCLTYCDIVGRFCPGTYASPQECRTACSQLPEVLSFDPAVGPQLFPVTSTVCPTP